MVSPAHRFPGLVAVIAAALVFAVLPAGAPEDTSAGLAPANAVAPTTHADGVGLSQAGLGGQSLGPPVWYTPELHERVLEAGEQGMGYDIALNQSVPVRWNFIQPGALMIYPEGCTMAFVLEPGDKITTAGHCVNGKEEPRTVEDEVRSAEDDVPGDTNLAGQLEPVWDQLPDPGAKDVVLVAGEHAPHVLVHIGDVDELQDNITTNDWAVVGIKDDFLGNVDPAVKGLGGPVGVYRDPVDLQNPVPVKHIGWGVATPGMPRVGLAVKESAETDNYNVQYLGVASPGDSGGPVLAIDPDQPNKPFGLALGIHSDSGHNRDPRYADWDPKYAYTASATRVTVLEDNDYQIMTSGVPDPVEPTPPGWLTEALSRVDECINDAAYLAENAPAAGEYDLCEYLTLLVPPIETPWEVPASSDSPTVPKAGACVSHWLASECATTDTLADHALGPQESNP